MSHGSPNYCGVAILFKKGVYCTVHYKILDPLGRYTTLKVEFRNKMYLLINMICAINKHKCIVNFFNNLLPTLKKKRKEILDEEEGIVMGGDFNCPLNIALDEKEGY